MNDTWDLMKNWGLVLPPSRPSRHQLTLLHEKIRDVDRNLPVAILGSTPEYRDLLFEEGFQDIIILDKNKSFFKAMSDMRIYDNEEKYIEGNWLETLKVFENTFALILSDLTSGNISYDERSSFYELISDALKGGGIFFDKILTHPGPNISTKELINKYLNLPLNLLHVNHFSCEMLFCSELLDIRNIVDTSMFYNLLKEENHSPRIQSFIEQAKYITPMGGIWWYGVKWAELGKTYCIRLKRISIEDDQADSPYYGRLKFFTSIKEA